MVFKSEIRKIDLRNKDKSLEEICDKMNSVYGSNLKCYPSISITPSIHVTKKYFSEFFPFNFAHLASLMIEAKAEYIDRSENQLIFIIGLNTVYSISFLLAIILLAGLMIYVVFNLELLVGLCVLGFATIGVLWSEFLYRLGMKNFLKNWDEFLRISI